MMSLLPFLLPILLLLLLTPTLALPQASATTTTSLAASPTCTTGPPASQPEEGLFSGTDDTAGVITNYTRIRPLDATGAGYLVFGEWYTEHLVSGPHVRFPSPLLSSFGGADGDSGWATST